MKLIPYPLPKTAVDINLLYKHLEENTNLCEKIRAKYREDGLFHYTNNLNQIRLHLNNNLKDKTILDLGCGTINYILGEKFEPWLARGLHEIGAKVIGIDKGNLNGELFKHYSIDLRNPNSLDFLKNNSIDLAGAFSLFDAPSLTHPKETFELLLPQLERILKPEGVFIFDPLNTGYKI